MRGAYEEPDVLRLKRLGIDTYQELVIFMARSAPICRSEGWAAQSRLQVTCKGRSIIATLNVMGLNARARKPGIGRQLRTQTRSMFSRSGAANKLAVPHEGNRCPSGVSCGASLRNNFMQQEVQRQIF